MKLLAIDTASAQCSVALVVGSDLIVRDAATARDHAQLILPMIDAVLAEAGISLRQLDGLAFGRGPGSFTGVRVAAAVTQGLAAGTGLPVRPVSDLRALAMQALARVGTDQRADSTGHLLACMDARMAEVYWSACSGSGGCPTIGDERVSAPAEVATDFPRPCMAAAGKGLAAWPQIVTALQLPVSAVFADAEPHAREIARLAVADLATGAQWLDAAEAQPVYLRDQVAVAKNAG